MKRVWTARSLAAVLGGSLLYFLITVPGDDVWVIFPPCSGSFSRPSPARRIGVGCICIWWPERPRFGVPVLMNLVVLLLFLAAGELSGWMAVDAGGRSGAGGAGAAAGRV